MATVADNFQSYIESVLDPKPIDSLEPLRNFTILLFESSSREPIEIQLDNIYPFMTIFDIKLAIYHKLKMEDRALPDFVFLGKRILPGKKVIPVEFNWSIGIIP